MFKDMQNTPNVLMAMFEFPNPGGAGEKKRMLQFEVRHWDHNPEGAIPAEEDKTNTYMTSATNTVGNLFYGSGGYMAKRVERWQVFKELQGNPEIRVKGLAITSRILWMPSGPEIRNWPKGISGRDSIPVL